ncbi:MAG: cation:proton antiporter [Candidatus Thorarchaeota archaeon]
MAVELPIVAAILIGGAAIAKIAEQYKFPYPIPLILAGILLAQWIPGEELLAGIGIDFIAQLTLATVLFYAGLNMNIRELRTSIKSVLMLATLGVFLTALIAGFTIYFLVGIGIFTAMLIGAILSPTDPAALFSVLESGGVKVKRKIFSILEGEAVFNDATAVILVITLFLPFVVPSEEVALYIVLLQFLASMGLGVVIGFAVAYIMGVILLSPVGETNVSVLTATTPILAYGLGELFAGAGIHPGALAAVFAGIFMANTRRIGLNPLPQKSMRGVMKNVSFAFEIVIFILLGLTLNTEYMMTHQNTTLAGMVIAALVIFVARPAAVFLVTSPDRSMNWKDRFFVSWAGVKGVASAALAAIAVAVIIVAPENMTLGFFPDVLAEEINAIVFIVLMFSLIVQGITTPFLASRLDLVEEKDAAKAITAQRDAARHTLLQLVDQYTEGKVESDLYTRLKAELEEEIFTLEDELRVVISERRAQLRELEVREMLYKSKLNYFQALYEKGDIPNSAYEDRKTEIELELSEIESMKRFWRTGKESHSG